jgi:hypothetical protein
MDSQVLVEELARFKEGQPGAESRVLFAISRSNLFMLAADDVTDTQSSEVVVKVRLVEVDGRPTAYIFSSIESLTSWCSGKGYAANMLPIHGGDVSFLLPKDTWIQFDPGTEHSVVLSPQQMSMINQEPAAGMGVIVAPKPDMGFVSPASENEPGNSAPALYKPVESELPSSQGPSKKKFIPRSHPTTLFAAPNIEKKEDPKKQGRSHTTSNLKKIIKSDEGQK